MLTEGALNFNTNCKVRRVDCVKDEVHIHRGILEEILPFK